MEVVSAGISAREAMSDDGGSEQASPHRAISTDAGGGEDQSVGCRVRLGVFSVAFKHFGAHLAVFPNAQIKSRLQGLRGW